MLSFLLLEGCATVQYQKFNKKANDYQMQSLASSDKISKALLDYHFSHEAPASLISISDFESVITKCVGFKSIENKETLKETSAFNIGSISKTFSAVIILQMVEEGKLNLKLKYQMPQFWR